MASTRSRERITRNFIARYGQARLRELLSALSNLESGEQIARSFDVSRERVRQWKNTFGTLVTLYQIHPEVLALAQPEPKPPAEP